MALKGRESDCFGVRSPKVWNLAIYIRLSKEDGGSSDESESVTNQRAILREHLSNIDDGDRYILFKEYVDDGISGTTDDERDSFQEMLKDIRKGLVNCVIVKDLARSFRNYSDQGYYLDDWFPRHNVRFISLYHQPLDSYREPQNMRSIAVPIQGVLNENHCAETSEKVREVLDIKRRKGEHIGSFAVYGYLKDPNNKNGLVIDEEAAQVVREIYQRFLDGMSKRAIVGELNDSGILCPSRYKQERLGLRYQNARIDPARPPLWCSATVTGILQNRMYCGDMVQGRYRVKSYKVHIQEKVPQEEWYVVESTHAPIIERETFERAQKLLRRGTRTAGSKGQPYLFSGFLRCADCQKSMTRSRVGNAVYYYCRTYKDRSKTACTKHTIRHDDLQAAVLLAIQLQIHLTVNAQEVVQRVKSMPISNAQSGRLTGALAQSERELSRIARYQQALYQDWKDGELTRLEYRQMKEDYGQRYQAISRTISSLRAQQEALEGEQNAEPPLLTALQRNQNIDVLTRDVLIELVDFIEVHEDGNISIHFLFSDGLES